MKKLLLASLLVVGATSFAAVTGTVSTTGEASLPITVRGDVVQTTKTTLVLTPLTNAGANGNTMEFDFDKLAIGSSQKLTGEFKAELVKNNALVEFTNTPEVTLTKSGGSENSEQTVDVTKADIKYVAGPLAKTGKGYKGSVGIEVIPKATGAFVDNSVAIKVNVTGQLEA